MDEFIDYYMKNNRSKSKHTPITMRTNIKRIEKMLGKKTEDITPDDFKHLGELVSKLMGDYSLSTSISTLLAIKSLMKYKKGKLALMDEIQEYINELVKMRTDENHDQTKTEKEKANWIDWEVLGQDVARIAGTMLEGKHAFTKFRNFMLLALYSLQPPTRIGNYLEMMVRDRSKMKRDGTSLNKSYNYIIHEGDGKYSFVFNKYKTAKSVGQITHSVESEILNKVIHKWLTDYIPKSKYFLDNTKGRPMDQSAVSQAIKQASTKMLGKDLTLNSFRHIFLTHYLSTNPSIEDKKKVLTLIGHKYNPSQAEQYARI